MEKPRLCLTRQQQRQHMHTFTTPSFPWCQGRVSRWLAPISGARSITVDHWWAM